MNKDPEILYTKVFCPACGEPTGPKSTCYDHSGKKNQLIMGEKGLIPLFSEACLFRQQNLWRGNTNYGVGSLLIERLAMVEGLDSLEATGPYEITFAVSRLFEEQAVKTALSGTFRTFVKEMLAKRTPSEDLIKTTVLGITMPNGNTIYIDPTTTDAAKQGAILEEISNRIKDAKLVH